MSETATVTTAAVASSVQPVLCAVLRSFYGFGALRHQGEVVDATAWRMRDSLLDDRYLRLLLHNDPDPVRGDDGRMFIDEASLQAYLAASEQPVVPAEQSVELTPSTALKLGAWMAQPTSYTQES